MDGLVHKCTKAIKTKYTKTSNDPHHTDTEH